MAAARNGWMTIGSAHGARLARSLASAPAPAPATAARVELLGLLPPGTAGLIGRMGAAVAMAGVVVCDRHGCQRRG